MLNAVDANRPQLPGVGCLSALAEMVKRVPDGILGDELAPVLLVGLAEEGKKPHSFEAPHCHHLSSDRLGQLDA